MDINTPNPYQTISANLHSGNFQITRSSIRPYITMTGGKKVIVIRGGSIQTPEVSLTNIINAQNTYAHYQACHDRTITPAPAFSTHQLRPQATAQANSVMEHRSQQTVQNPYSGSSREQFCRPPAPPDTKLTIEHMEWLRTLFIADAYFNNEVEAITPLDGSGCYEPDQNGGFTYSSIQKPLKNYSSVKEQYDTWFSQASLRNKPFPPVKDTTHANSWRQRAEAVLSHQPPSRSNTCYTLARQTGAQQPDLEPYNYSRTNKPYSNSPFGSMGSQNRSYLPGLPSAQNGARPKHQSPGTNQAQPTRTRNTLAQPNRTPAATRQTSGKTIQDDVILPAPPTVENADLAKQRLQAEFENQLKSIKALKIEERYELKEKNPYSGGFTTITGGRKKQFTDDLKFQLQNANQKIDQCSTPGTINQTFRNQWLLMKRLGVYRYWCLRQAAPNNPLPHYPGRRSIRNTGDSCGPDASIIQLLHSGTMNYFIFRPLEEKPASNPLHCQKTNIEQQSEWQRLYREILFDQANSSAIVVPEWLRQQFQKMWNFSQVNDYNDSFFDPDIVWKAKEPLKRLDSPGANTKQKLKERILGDWRACRLHTGGWHYVALIKQKNGSITSVDNGRVGHRTFKNANELLDLFLKGKHPYDNPSLIDFWE